MEIQQIFHNNRAWVKAKLNLDPGYFRSLSEGQNPGILYIGCSDSRVAAEEIMGAGPGDVFVHRNIANLVPVKDPGSGAVINYAVTVLKVKHIVVCGHYQCGGVKAAMQTEISESLEPWLKPIHELCLLHQDELHRIPDENKRLNRLVELNVREQIHNILKIPGVWKAVRERSLKVHGWVFDIHSGHLIDLKININP